MKWTYSIKQKTTTALLMAAVLGLVMWNNFAQGKQFEKIVGAFASLYEDRLIVESYIYNISELLHRKKHILESPVPHDNSENDLKLMVIESDSTIKALIALYRETKFTEKEMKLFDSLIAGIEKLLVAEQAYIKAGVEMQKESKQAIISLAETNLEYLSLLSDIQVSEGKQMNKDSKAALMSHISSSQFETSLLIIIAIIIQMLIFASRSMRSILKQKPGMN